MRHVEFFRSSTSTTIIQLSHCQLIYLKVKKYITIIELNIFQLCRKILPFNNCHTVPWRRAPHTYWKKITAVRTYNLYALAVMSNYTRFLNLIFYLIFLSPFCFPCFAFQMDLHLQQPLVSIEWLTGRFHFLVLICVPGSYS